MVALLEHREDFAAELVEVRVGERATEKQHGARREHGAEERRVGSAVVEAVAVVTAGDDHALRPANVAVELHHRRAAVGVPVAVLVPTRAGRSEHASIGPRSGQLSAEHAVEVGGEDAAKGDAREGDATRRSWVSFICRLTGASSASRLREGLGAELADQHLGRRFEREGPATVDEIEDLPPRVLLRGAGSALTVLQQPLPRGHHRGGKAGPDEGHATSREHRFHQPIRRLHGANDIQRSRAVDS